jgi:hypothetical protein
MMWRAKSAISRRHQLRRIIEPARIGECRLGEADAARLDGHALGELILGATQPLGETDRCVVARLDDQSLEQVVNRRRRIDGHEHG